MITSHDPSADREELHAIRAGVTCALVLEREGFLLDKKESTRHCPKYRSQDGRIVIVNHEDAAGGIPTTPWRAATCSSWCSICTRA